MIFDTHAHYDSRQFNDDREELFASMAEGFMVVNVGADIKSSDAAVGFAEKYDFMYAAVGAHPDEVGELFGLEKAEGDSVNNGEGLDVATLDCSAAMEHFRQLAKCKKVVAIGEIGLDYHWNIWTPEIQKKAFEAQWALAAELNLPVEIHSRDAAEDTMQLVKALHEKYPKVKIDMHCYSYSVEQAREYLKLGMMFGVGGVVTFKNGKKLKEVVAELPMENILLETDCPYLAPEPNRSKRNYSGYLTYVADMIAEIKGITREEVLKKTEENARRFFGI